MGCLKYINIFDIDLFCASSWGTVGRHESVFWKLAEIEVMCFIFNAVVI